MQIGGNINHMFLTHRHLHTYRQLPLPALGILNHHQSQNRDHLHVLRMTVLLGLHLLKRFSISVYVGPPGFMAYQYDVEDFLTLAH